MGLLDFIKQKQITGPLQDLMGGPTVNQGYAEPDAGMNQIMGAQANKNTLDPVGTANQQAEQAMLQAKPLYDTQSYSASYLPESIQAALKDRSSQMYSSDLDQLKKQLRALSFGQASDMQQTGFSQAKQMNAMTQGRAEARARYDMERSAIKQGLISNILGTAGMVGGMIAGGMAGGPMGAMQGGSLGSQLASFDPKKDGVAGGWQSGSQASSIASGGQSSTRNQMSNIG